MAFLLLAFSSVALFKYVELAPTGETKNLNVGPFVVSINMVHLKWRTAKPIHETAYAPAERQSPQTDDKWSAVRPGSLSASVNAAVSDNPSSEMSGTADTVAPSLPQSAHPQIQLAADTPVNPDSYDQFQNVFSLSMTPPPPVARDALRLATVCLNQADARCFDDPVTRNCLQGIAQSFDLLAIQGLYDYNTQLIQKWVAQLNNQGGDYAWLASLEESCNRKNQVAFIYNRRSLAADRSRMVFLEAKDRLDCVPLAVLFQARATDSARAFTFVAVAVDIPWKSASQGALLSLDLFSATQNAIPGEDDIILFGAWGQNVNQRPEFMYNPHLFWIWPKSISDYTNQPYTENMVFHKNVCGEYLSEYGILEVSQKSGLTQEQLSGFLQGPPLWADFQAAEKR